MDSPRADRMLRPSGVAGNTDDEDGVLSVEKATSSHIVAHDFAQETQDADNAAVIILYALHPRPFDDYLPQQQLLLPTARGSQSRDGG